MVIKMERILEGHILLFGDNIDTDQIYPGRYLELTDHQEIGKHAMEGVDPNFSQRLEPPGIIVGGKNFGCGSSREHAVITLKNAGVKVVIAESFGRIFYRNAINLGLLVLQSPKITQVLEGGMRVELDLNQGLLKFGVNNELKLQEIPPYVLEILNNGGLIPYLKDKVTREQKSEP